jgi:HD domain
VIVAQTNLQLQRQLELAGWTPRDRERVAAAYDLAAQLFSGQYRSSGKTFLAHLCGTASITEAVGGTADEVLAALMHAAYSQGDFGDGRRRVTRRKRDEVRPVLGTEAEALVAQYAAWPWRARLGALREEGPGVLADWERPIAFLRLANEVEEHVDFATQYCPRQGAVALPLADVERYAGDLGWPALGLLANEIASEDAEPVVPLSRQPDRKASEFVPARSTRTTLWVRCTGERGILRRATRAVPGARRVVDSWRRWRPTSSSE